VKNQLLTMRLERKKLRTDKSDLLGQVKQLCASLQEKEQELRDFIRNYQERVRETETTQPSTPSFFAFISISALYF